MIYAESREADGESINLNMQPFLSRDCANRMACRRAVTPSV